MKKLLLFNIFAVYCIVVSGQVGYQAYFGNLHSHTSYSDGQQTPWDAYLYARDVALLDFLAVTDHMEQLSSSEFSQCRNFAQLATTPAFAALWGYEWGSPYYGHVNVFNTTEMPSVFTYTDWSGFRQWMLDHSAAFAEFNHPGDEDYFNNWYDFEYKGAATDYCFPLIEFQNIQQADDWYELALNNGWHLSPVWNQDNHSADWGTKNNGRAGVWSTALNQTALFEAIRTGRTFATMDKNCLVWIESDANEMGSTCARYGNMPFRIVLNDTDNEAWNTIQLRSNNGLVLSFTAQGNIDTTLYLTLYTDKYLYVRAIQQDGDYVWSGPVYLNGTITGENLSEQNGKFSVFPSPAYHTVWVNNTNSNDLTHLMVTDITGKVILYQQLQQGSNEIQVYGWEKGVYVFELQNSSCTFRQKVIISR